MQVINIGEVLILDPQKAEQLQQCGFKYTKRNIDNKEVFVFITLAVKNRFFISSFIKYDILSTWKKLI